MYPSLRTGYDAACRPGRNSPSSPSQVRVSAGLVPFRKLSSVPAETPEATVSNRTQPSASGPTVVGTHETVPGEVAWRTCTVRSPAGSASIGQVHREPGARGVCEGAADPMRPQSLGVRHPDGGRVAGAHRGAELGVDPLLGEPGVRYPLRLPASVHDGLRLADLDQHAVRHELHAGCVLAVQ